MSAFLWRIIYAVVCVVIFWLVFPLFLSVVGFNPANNLIALMKICIACIAVLYVLFGPPPSAPF